MSAVAPSSPRSADRPRTITWAVIVNVVGGLAFLGAFALPGADDIPAAVIVFGFVTTAVLVALAWPLWNGRRWAAIILTVVWIVNVSSALPGLFDPPSEALRAAIVGGILVAAVLCWLLWHPDSRRFYRGA